MSPCPGVGVACGFAGPVVLGIDAHAHRPPRRDRLLPGVEADVPACAALPEGVAFSEKLHCASYSADGLTAAGQPDADETERMPSETAEYARPGQPGRWAAVGGGGLTAGGRCPLLPGGRL